MKNHLIFISILSVITFSEPIMAEDYSAECKKQNLSACNQWISTTPNSSEAYFYRAVTKASNNDTTGAMEDYDQAIKLNPDDFTYYFNRADLKTFFEDYEGAIDDLYKARNLNSTNPEIYKKISAYYKQIGDVSQALFFERFAEYCERNNPKERICCANENFIWKRSKIINYYELVMKKKADKIQSFIEESKRKVLNAESPIEEKNLQKSLSLEFKQLQEDYKNCQKAYSNDVNNAVYNAFNIICEKKGQKAGVLLKNKCDYHTETIDITDEVIEYLDTHYKNKP